MWGARMLRNLQAVLILLVFALSAEAAPHSYTMHVRNNNTVRMWWRVTQCDGLTDYLPSSVGLAPGEVASFTVGESPGGNCVFNGRVCVICPLKYAVTCAGTGGPWAADVTLPHVNGMMITVVDCIGNTTNHCPTLYANQTVGGNDYLTRTYRLLKNGTLNQGPVTLSGTTYTFRWSYNGCSNDVYTVQVDDLIQPAGHDSSNPTGQNTGNPTVTMTDPGLTSGGGSSGTNNFTVNPDGTNAPIQWQTTNNVAAKDGTLQGVGDVLYQVAKNSADQAHRDALGISNAIANLTVTVNNTNNLNLTNNVTVTNTASLDLGPLTNPASVTTFGGNVIGRLGGLSGELFSAAGIPTNGTGAENLVADTTGPVAGQLQDAIDGINPTEMTFGSVPDMEVTLMTAPTLGEVTFDFNPLHVDGIEDIFSIAHSMITWALVIAFFVALVKGLAEHIIGIGQTTSANIPNGEVQAATFGGNAGIFLYALLILVVVGIAVAAVKFGLDYWASQSSWVSIMNGGPLPPVSGPVAHGLALAALVIPFNTAVTLSTSFIIFRLTLAKAHFVKSMVMRVLPV